MEMLFWDTYAFVKMLEGNEDYLNYTQKSSVITTILNLMELHYVLIKTHNRRIADFYFNRFRNNVVEISDDVIIKANTFKFLMKSKKLSYVDCIGYVLAKEMGIKFLTGDGGFEELSDVEFVK